MVPPAPASRLDLVPFCFQQHTLIDQRGGLHVKVCCRRVVDRMCLTSSKQLSCVGGSFGGCAFALACRTGPLSSLYRRGRGLYRKQGPVFGSVWLVAAVIARVALSLAMASAGATRGGRGATLGGWAAFRLLGRGPARGCWRPASDGGQADGRVRSPTPGRQER